MVKNFSGQVKIEDVQKEFDKLVQRVNKMVTNYNSASLIKDHDYSVAGTTLAPSGYTLTVGGLKQVLENYDGCVFGCVPFKIGSSQLKVTDGILITQDQCFKISGQTLNGQGDTLYYDPANNKLTYGTTTTTQWTDWVQPTINSNTTWGQFSCTFSSGNAYKATKSSDISLGAGCQLVDAGSPEAAYKENISGALTWKFKQNIRLNQITFYNYAMPVMGAATGLDIVVTDLSGNIINTPQTPTGMYDWGTNEWTVDGNNQVVSGIKIKMTMRGRTSARIMMIGTLVVKGQYGKQVTSTGDTEDLYKICDLNWNRDSVLIADYPNIQNEDFSNSYKITTVKREISESQYNTLISNNGEGADTSSAPKFVWGNEMTQHEGQPTAYTRLFGTNVAQNYQNGHSRRMWWAAPSFLFVPKGIGNPYTYVNGGMQVVFNAKITK